MTLIEIMGSIMSKEAQEAEKIATIIELSKVLDKAAENYNWSKEKSEYARKWYLRYLYICKKHPDTYIAAISHAGDDLWHQHIIDTNKYKHDCNKLFGKFLEHQPIYGTPSFKDQEIFEKTKLLYNEAFGEVPTDLRRTSGNYSYGIT